MCAHMRMSSGMRISSCLSSCSRKPTLKPRQKTNPRTKPRIRPRIKPRTKLRTKPRTMPKMKNKIRKKPRIKPKSLPVQDPNPVLASEGTLVHFTVSKEVAVAISTIEDLFLSLIHVSLQTQRVPYFLSLYLFPFLF